jgi:hypothetical protein
VLIVLLAAIALALLFAGGLTWRRRRRRRVAPTALPGPTAVDHRPKPASTGLPVPQITLARGPQAALAGHPAPAPAKGFAALAQPVTDKGAARRAKPGPSSHSAERAAPPVRAFGYISVPSDSPLGSAAGRQSRAIEAACAARGWTFVGGVREPAPAIAGDRTRPGLEHVLERFQRGEANCLVVAELRRLTSSAVELGGLLDRLWRSGVRLLVLDLGIDTGTESGQLAAGALIRVGGWEHERVTERTANGLTAAPSRGTVARPTSG